MMAEVSSNRIYSVLITTLIGLAAIFMGINYAAEHWFHNTINTQVLAVSFTFTCVLALIYIRLFYLKADYYHSRFDLKDLDGGRSRIKVLISQKMHPGQLLMFLFKPLRYIEIHEMMLDHSETIKLSGKLQVIDERLYIENTYLKVDTELLQYINTSICLTVSTNRHQAIEGNISNYTVCGVEVIN